MYDSLRKSIRIARAFIYLAFYTAWKKAAHFSINPYCLQVVRLTDSADYF
jgi:hypothetical protein